MIKMIMSEKPRINELPKPASASPEALEVLKQRILDLRPAVLNFCRRILHGKDNALAEDLTQNTMMRATIRADSFRGNSSLKTWLLKIAVNEFYSHLRRPSSREVLHKKIATEDGEIEGDVFGTGEGTLDENMMALGIDLEHALEKLPRGDADIILQLIVGNTVQEIADSLGITPDTATSRIHHARQKLKKIMKTGD